MKKNILITIFLVATSSFAAMNDALLSFATKGPDRYADGSIVLDGEFYALVWVRDGFAFSGFKSDGTLVDPINNALVLKAALARNGACRQTLFQISAAFADSHTDGAYAVVLLDTRVSKGEETSVGANSLINGFEELANAIAAGSASTTQAPTPEEGAQISQDPSYVSSANDGLLPQIKDIQIIGENVFLTVENVPGFLRVQSGENITDFSITSIPQFADGSEKDVLFVLPKPGKSGFFKILRQ